MAKEKSYLTKEENKRMFNKKDKLIEKLNERLLAEQIANAKLETEIKTLRELMGIEQDIAELQDFMKEQKEKNKRIETAFLLTRDSLIQILQNEGILAKHVEPTTDERVLIGVDQEKIKLFDIK